jgi:hypothetical protein
MRMVISKDLVQELGEVIPQFNGRPDLVHLLGKFCQICMVAAGQRKIVFLLGD